MMRKIAFIVAALIVSAVGFWLYFEYRVPPGVEPKGANDESIAWISLAAAIVSLLTAVVGVVQKLIELRAGRESSG